MSKEMTMDEMIEVLARYRYNAKHDADRIKALEAELSRLRASSFVTAVPAEQYERLKRAAELVIKQSCRYHPPIIAMQILKDWDEAKGGQP